MRKHKDVPLHAMKAHSVYTATVPLIFNISVWSTSHPSHFIPGKQLQYTHWVGPTASQA